MAKKKGIQGWHAMPKDQLVQALARVERRSATKSPSKSGAKASGKASKSKTPNKSKTAKAGKTSGKASSGAKTGAKSAAGPRAVSASKTSSRAKSPSRKSGRDSSSARKPASRKSGSRATAARKSSASASKSASAGKASNAGKSKPSRKAATASSTKAQSKSAKKTKTAKSRSAKGDAVALRRLQESTTRREQMKDLAYASDARRRLEAAQKNGHAETNGHPTPINGVGKNGPTKDRIVLLVRDSYWLQACWDITRHSVVRAQASMAENWHTARPILRLIEMEVGGSTSSAERVVRDMEIHGGVNNWYIDVQNPPKAYRVDIGYLAIDGRFHVLARSNTVTTPEPGGADAVDRNWADVAENYEKIYALSGGYTSDKGDLRDVFEERLHRPMGSSVGARFGAGAERMLQRDRNFRFDVDAEIIVFGATQPDAHVSISGEPVKLRPDGGFAVRLALPDRRQVLPVTAASRDGVEERTIVLAIERNTKVMEPVVHDPNEE